MPNLLKDIEAVEVSLVDKPAINRQFLLVKRMTSNDTETKKSPELITAPTLGQKIKALLFGNDEDKSALDADSLISLCAKLDEVKIAVKAAIDTKNIKSEGGPLEMNEDEIKALIATEVKKALELSEDQKKAVDDQKAADTKFQNDTATALEGIKKSVEGLVTTEALDLKFKGLDDRIKSLEEGKPEKKSLDVEKDDKKDEGQKSEGEASFKGVLFH